MSNTLLLAVDVSKDDGMVIAVVGASEHVLKNEIVRRASWVKHFRKIPSTEKRAYMRRFPTRFFKIYRYLSIVRVFNDVERATLFINSLSPGLLIVDDKIFDKINYKNKIYENAPKPRYLEILCLLADNVANYFRIAMKKSLRKYLEELRKFEK